MKEISHEIFCEIFGLSDNFQVKYLMKSFREIFMKYLMKSFREIFVKHLMKSFDEIFL